MNQKNLGLICHGRPVKRSLRRGFLRLYIVACVVSVVIVMTQYQGELEQLKAEHSYSHAPARAVTIRECLVAAERTFFSTLPWSLFALSWFSYVVMWVVRGFGRRMRCWCPRCRLWHLVEVSRRTTVVVCPACSNALTL